MGGRGSFVSIDSCDFSFVANGQKYILRGTIDDNIQIIERIPTDQNSAIPRYSHTANRIYVVMEGKKLKSIAFFDERHVQTKVIDFDHFHKGLSPHTHYNGLHNDAGNEPTAEEWFFIKKILEGIKK